MNDWQVRQIVLAIRAHARAMVVMKYRAFFNDAPISKVIGIADDLLAVLSASSGEPRFYPHFRCPRCGPCVDVDEDGCCATCGRNCGRVARPDSPSVSKAATPPLSADAVADAYGLNEYETVTVRRDDLRMLLERHGSPRFPHAPEWLFRIREAVSR